ncbi:MAG: hypothetical protein IPP01_07405 [Saprospiraceae bacterium]|nr:hypothetical protein [Saprospiraceae bacterium]
MPFLTPLLEGVTVYLRTNEILTGSINADWVVDNKDKNTLVDKAFELLEKQDFKAQTNSSNLGLELNEKILII